MGRLRMEKRTYKKELVEDRIKNFWGYGSLDSPIWLIGMEEGCDNIIKHVEDRLMDTKGHQTIELRKLRDAKHQELFSDGCTKTQPIWRLLIKILLALSGENLDNKTNNEIKERVLSFQKKQLAKENHCLLELMPLPAKSMKASEWNNVYGDFMFNNDLIKSRRDYKKYIKPFRVSKLIKLIKHKKPRMVIFYGKGYLDDWNKITDNKLRKRLNHGELEHAKQGETVFFTIYHPVSRGKTDEYWKEIIREIKRKWSN